MHFGGRKRYSLRSVGQCQAGNFINNCVFPSYVVFSVSFNARTYMDPLFYNIKTVETWNLNEYVYFGTVYSMSVHVFYKHALYYFP